MRKNKFIYTLILLLVSSFYLIAQNNNVSKITDNELVEYKQQAENLVKFMEFAFNTLGSDKTNYKDKDIIINHSYLKFFNDSTVQIEDDLIEKREAVTNKDVQAYLKDIDFFFKDVKFNFTIEDITTEINDNGNTFFKVKTVRNLNGITLNGNQINNSIPRFIEININDNSKELKIASVYTTKSSEEEELMAWWNMLSDTWRSYFSKMLNLNVGIDFSKVVKITNNVVHTVEPNYYDTQLPNDTIKHNIETTPILVSIRNILKIKTFDIASNSEITDLEPLSAFRNLESIIANNVKISSLSPLRHLVNLKSINVSNTFISDLEPLRYNKNLENLNIASTYVKKIINIQDLEKLEFLDISDTEITDIENITHLTSLRKLQLINCNQTDFNFIDKLNNLENIDLSKNNISNIDFLSNATSLIHISLKGNEIVDLSPLNKLQNLQSLNIDNTNVSDLMPLSELQRLKIVYCDHSKVDQSSLDKFLNKAANIEVIYNTEILLNWWQSIDNKWKEEFKKIIKLDKEPTREQLHELIKVKSIDVAGNKEIADIKPLEKLLNLRSLNLQATSVKDISPLNFLLSLEHLNISNNEIENIAPIANHSELKELIISNTIIKNIEPLRTLSNLSILFADSTQIVDFSPLFKLKKANKMFFDNSPEISKYINSLWDSIPNCLIVFQTEVLKTWWLGLPDYWKGVFNEKVNFEIVPNRIQLQQIASITNLNIESKNEIKTLEPLVMLKQLNSLNISGLTGCNVMYLNNLTRLEEFICSNTPIDDLVFLSSNKNLKRLNCSNSAIKYLDFIKYFTNLEVLDISGTKISKLNPLSKCFNLAELYCYNTPITNVKPLYELYGLKVLKIYNTKVSERKINKLKDELIKTEIIYY